MMGGLEPCESSPFMLACLLQCFCAGHMHTVVLFMVAVFFTCLKDTISKQISCSSGSYSLSAPSSTTFLEPQEQQLCCRCTHWSWISHGYLFAAFDQLFISLVTFICYKNKLLLQCGRAILTFGYEAKHLQYSQTLYSFRKTSVVSIILGSMTSATTDSLLDLQ